MNNEKTPAKTGNGRRMKIWIAVILLTTGLCVAHNYANYTDGYEAGRESALGDVRKKLESKMAAGKRFYSYDLQLWITPTGYDDAKALRVKGKAPQAALKGE